MLENNIVDFREIAREVLDENPLFLDTETTGLYGDAEVVEIAIANAQGNILFESLVRPSHPIPPDATAVHGITDDMVQDAPTWADIHGIVDFLLGGRTVAIYNADFDVRMLRQTAALYDKTIPDFQPFCVMKHYARRFSVWNDYFGDYKWVKLIYAAENLGVTTPAGRPHRAAYDCLLTVGILRSMAGITDINNR
jgi:DNA polymerase III epsilon subunit-like protein